MKFLNFLIRRVSSQDSLKIANFGIHQNLTVHLAMSAESDGTFQQCLPNLTAYFGNVRRI
jgi:hypothetical protein